jgi:hypothetical protein
MTTIVCNLVTAAVTEYDWDHPALSATRLGSDDGLFTLGGDTDDDAAIEAHFDTGVTLREGTLKNRLDEACFTIDAEDGANMLFRVNTADATYEYPFVVRKSGISRAKPGAGIRENLLGFGFSNLDGADFTIERMDVRNLQSKQRRL